MKKLIILLTLIGLATTTLAFDYELASDIGVGSDGQTGGAVYQYFGSPARYSITGADETGYIYFMFPTAGEGELTLLIDCKYSGIPFCNWSCYSYNYSTTTNILTRTQEGLTVAINGSSYTYTQTYNSNIGVVACNNRISIATAGSINISIAGSGANKITEYYPQYNAGEWLELQSVNKYYNTSSYQATPQYTYALNPVTNVIEMTSRNTTTTGCGGFCGGGVNFNQFFPSCSISGLQNYWFNNWEGGSGIGVQTYYQMLNISPYEANTITGFNYELDTNQYFSDDISLNLSVSSSNPAVTDWIVWYIDGDIYSASTGSYHAQINLTKRDTPYHIEVQLEDNDCGIQNSTYYPTTGFYAYVGQYVTLHGITYGRDVFGDVQTISGVSIQLNDSDTAYYQESAGNGSYLFQGIEPGTYTIRSTKNFYTQTTETITLSAIGDDYETIYGHDIVLNQSPSTPTYNYILDCTANITEVDVTCCVQTNNPSIYYLSVIGTGASGYQQFALMYNQSQCLAFAGEGAAVYCGQTYTAYVGGVGSNITDTAITPDCFAVTTTSTSTTTPYVTTTTLPTDYQLNCVAETDEVDIECWYNTTNHDPSMRIEKATGSSTTQYIASFYLSPFGFYNGSLNLSEVLDGVDYPALECSNWYWIYIGGHESATGQWVETVTCNASFTTTTASTTTLPIPYTPPVTNPPFIGNGSANVVSFNCSNLTGKLMVGDVYHAALCPFILILGVSLFYGFALLMVILVTFKITESYAACSMLGLLYTATFISVMPQPTINYLSVGVAFTIGLGLYSIFRK